MLIACQQETRNSLPDNVTDICGAPGGGRRIKQSNECPMGLDKIDREIDKLVDKHPEGQWSALPIEESEHVLELLRIPGAQRLRNCNLVGKKLIERADRRASPFRNGAHRC